MALADARIDWQFPWWIADWFIATQRYFVAWGGRGGGKSEAITRFILARMMEESIKVASVREVEDSIKQSNKSMFDRVIRDLGLEGSFFTILREEIRGANGSQLFFQGLSDVTADNARGLDGVRYCWFDEADAMSPKARRLLYPSVRAPESQIIFSFNPVNRTDPVYVDFLNKDSARARNAIVQKVLWSDNKWFSSELEGERQMTLEQEPDLYPHIWDGEPLDEDAEQKVLSYGLITSCIEAWDLAPGFPLFEGLGPMQIGLDIADSGLDRNALVGRRGPCVFDVKRRYSPRLGVTARWANDYCNEHGGAIMAYDAGGIGAGITSHLAELPRLGYKVVPTHFDGEVTGKKVYFTRRITNQDFFLRRNSQMSWVLRLRAQNTQQLMQGSPISPEICLFINPEIKELTEFMRELNQPIWRNTTAGKKQIVKKPKDTDPSPDRYDATCLAFERDSRHGLRT